MRPLQSLSAGTEVKLRRLLDQVETKADYQRVLCLWLRALGLSATEIARTLGWRTSSVYHLHSRYLHEGITVLLGAGRGGRHHALLSPEQERRLLAPFASTASQGGVAEASLIRRAYEGQEVGHRVAKSTVYRLLARQGWRKLAPRPAHPDASQEAQKAFKKSFVVWCAPKPYAKHNVA
jgi:transposase